MKRFLTAVSILLLLSPTLVLAAGKVITVDRPEVPSFIGYADNKCIVVFKEGTPAVNTLTRGGIAMTGVPALDAIHEGLGVERFGKQFPGSKDNSAYETERVLTRYHKAFFPPGNLEKVMDAYSRLPFVEKVEPIAIHAFAATPNDYYYDDSTSGYPYYQWHYWDNYGIDANLAWDSETGDATVVVGILDSGVRYYHHEIGGTDPPGPNDNVTNGNVWVNTGEIPGNGIDDDNNGYIDDVIGWDFVETSGGIGVTCIDADCSGADNDPQDGDGHGTHVAGTVAAITNNDASWGVAGVAGGWNDGTTNYTANGVKLMCLRIGYRAKYRGMTVGVVHMDYAAEAMTYVATMVQKGVNVAAVNCSWGSSTAGGLPAAVDNLLAHDVMVIAAAGNSGSSSPDYLGGRTDVLDVGATDRAGNPASWSNYGSWVDVAAPGVAITSTYHNPDDPAYDYIALLDGTSMSCPHAVAVAALLESKDPSLTGPQKFAIMTDVNNTKSYNKTKAVGVGIVSAKKCLDAIGEPCDLVANFSGSPTSGCVPLTVNFTDLSTGTGINGWSWNFGDGVGTSTAQNPSYTYNNAGTYTVTLTVSSSTQGCSDEETKTGYISVGDVPVANFSGSPTSGNAPLTVNFTDLSTGNPTAWSWDFGDGVGTSTSKNPSYTYNNVGTYTVTLTASNSCGSDGETKTDYITVTETQECVMHVSDMAVTRQAAGGPNRVGVASVTVVDQYGQPVANATVYGFFNAPNTSTKSGVTNSSGVASITSDKTRTPPTDWCFEVTNITHATCTYNSSANVVTKECESGPVFRTVVTLPEGYALGQNNPNPFNPTTEISFSLPEAARVMLEVFNIAGQRVAVLADGSYPVGTHTVVWNASDQASGIYLYRLTTELGVETRKMVLLK